VTRIKKDGSMMKFLWFGKTEKKIEPSPLEDLQSRLQATTNEMNDLIDVLRDILLLRNDWKRFIVYNLLAGIIRGVGAALGSTLIFAIILYIVTQVIDLDLPLISEWLSDLITMVEQKRGIVR
jgi:hypothetical protein